MNIEKLILGLVLLLVLIEIIRFCVWRLDIANAKYEKAMAELGLSRPPHIDPSPRGHAPEEFDG